MALRLVSFHQFLCFRTLHLICGFDMAKFAQCQLETCFTNAHLKHVSGWHMFQNCMHIMSSIQKDWLQHACCVPRVYKSWLMCEQMWVYAVTIFSTRSNQQKWNDSVIPYAYTLLLTQTLIKIDIHDLLECYSNTLGDNFWPKAWNSVLCKHKHKDADSDLARTRHACHFDG